MIIKKLSDVSPVSRPGYDQVKKQIVLGPADGSEEIVLRYFSLEAGGKSPHHSHAFPHLVKIESGHGLLLDEMGNERPVQKGDYVYIHDNEIHQFKNTGSELFDFICIVPKRGEG